MKLRPFLPGLGVVLAIAVAVARGATPPPGVVILDDGGEASEVRRGWPVHFHWFGLTRGSTNEPLTVRNPSGTELQVPAHAPGEWWLSPAQSRALPAGEAAARVGSVELEIRVVDPAEPLSPDLLEMLRPAEVRYALATGRLAEARSGAEAWVAAHPDRPLPRALLGEVLTAQGRPGEASEAFESGLQRVRWRDHPPEDLLQAASDALDAVLEGYPWRPAEPPEEPEPATLEAQDTAYAADANGQWAAAATASSEYRASGDYSASRVLGAPNVTRYGDSPQAWASRLADAGMEWLEVTFANPVRARGIRVRQVFNPGAIVRIDVYDAAGTATTVFSGTDTQVYAAGQIAWFVARFAPTANPVQRVRITLDSARVKGWNEIDAVQLVAAPSAPVTPPSLSYVFRADLGSLEFTSWPPGFALERATRLDPPDWVIQARQPPVQWPVSGGAAFFRLVQVP